MNQLASETAGIIRVPALPKEIKSNVMVRSNVYVRREDTPDPSRDVAFRCRVRGYIALRDIVPPGIIDAVNGHHEIREIDEAERSAAFSGTLPGNVFNLLPEQVAGISPFRCIDCGRSEVSVWYEDGRVRRTFVRCCMCKRTAQEEGPR